MSRGSSAPTIDGCDYLFTTQGVSEQDIAHEVPESGVSLPDLASYRQSFLELMEMHLGSDGTQEIRVTLEDGTEVVASPDRSRLSLTVSGAPDTVIEIGQQLACVSSAVRSSATGAVSSPIVKETTEKGQTENSITLAIQLRCQEEPLT
ncbi:hypothetical protein LA080_014914 [Diaporthe eres]|nr:hypothetical protein LA080_014914 [Diaporthe eres]